MGPICRPYGQDTGFIVLSSFSLSCHKPWNLGKVTCRGMSELTRRTTNHVSWWRGLDLHFDFLFFTEGRRGVRLIDITERQKDLNDFSRFSKPLVLLGRGVITKVRVFNHTENMRILSYLEFLHNNWGHLGVRLIDHTDILHTWNNFCLSWGVVQGPTYRPHGFMRKFDNLENFLTFSPTLGVRLIDSPDIIKSWYLKKFSIFPPHWGSDSSTSRF